MGRLVFRNADGTQMQTELDVQLVGTYVAAGTATAASGAATLNKATGVITSEAITTAAGATYTLTLANTKIAPASVVMASVALTAAGGTPAVASVKPAAGSVVIIVQNIHATVAFGGAINIAFTVLN